MASSAGQKRARGRRSAPGEVGGRSVGVALGAGGARGLAHVGVLRTLAAAGIPVDAIAGTSIGAVVGAMYAAGQLEQFEKQVRGVEWSDVLRMFDPVWPRAGLMSGTRAVEWLTGVLGDWRIEDLAIPFAAVSVDLVTGEEILITEGRVIDAIRASMSIPGVFVPHRQGKRLLVDGALRNPVPVSALEPLGAEIRIAVNLHAVPVREIRSLSASDASQARRPIAARVADAVESRLARFRKRGDRSRGPKPEPGSDEARQSGGPNLFEILTASMSVLEHELARHRLAREPVDVILSPDVHAIRAFEFHKARHAIQAGQSEAERALPEIRKVLARRRRRFLPKATSARR